MHTRTCMHTYMHAHTCMHTHACTHACMAHMGAGKLKNLTSIFSNFRKSKNPRKNLNFEKRWKTPPKGEYKEAVHQISESYNIWKVFEINLQKRLKAVVGPVQLIKHTHACIHTCIHAHTHMHACTHTCMHADTCMHAHTCIHVHTYACMHTHKHGPYGGRQA